MRAGAEGARKELRGGEAERVDLRVGVGRLAERENFPRDDMTTETSGIGLHSEITMDELLARLPGARRALFAKYHIGGCQSCGFEGSETLASVCARNEGIDPGEVMAHLEESAEADRRLQIGPEELREAMGDGEALRLIDVRSREEHEAVKLPGSELMTQELLQAMFAGDKGARVVVYCHHGQRSLDAAAYLAGHGMTCVKSLEGGIDGWSERIDPSVPRYRLEME